MQVIPAYMHYSEFNSGWSVAAEAMRLVLAELSPGSHTMTVVVDGESLTLPDRMTCTVQVEVPTDGGHTVDRDAWESVMCLLAVGVADAEREGQIVVVSPATSHVTRCWDLWEGRITALPVTTPERVAHGGGAASMGRTTAQPATSVPQHPPGAGEKSGGIAFQNP